MLHEESCLDMQTIKKLETITAKRGPIFWESLVKHFLAHSSKLTSEITQFHHLEDMEQVNKAAHKLKGTAASFGASALAKLSEEIENHTANNDKTELDMSIQQLDECYINTQAQYLTLFKQNSGD